MVVPGKVSFSMLVPWLHAWGGASQSFKPFLYHGLIGAHTECRKLLLAVVNATPTYEYVFDIAHVYKI